jgi:hypothetical protein
MGMDAKTMSQQSLTPRADLIEQYITITSQLIGAAADYAGGRDKSRPDEEVSADIRRLRVITSAFMTALAQAAAFAERTQPGAFPPGTP